MTGELRTCCRRGGALLLTDMVREATKGQDIAGIQGPILDAPEGLAGLAGAEGIEEKHFGRLTHDEVVHSVIQTGEFRTSAKSDKDDKTIRVAQTHGFSGPAEGDPTLTVTVPVPADSESFVLVLDDTGNHFRQDQKQWDNLLNKKPRLIVYKLHRPLPLAKDNQAESNPLWARLMRDHRERTVAVLSADDLRNEGAVVSRQLSWERSAKEVLWDLISHQEFKPLAECRWLIIRLGLDGAVCWRRAKEGTGDK